MLHFAAPLGYFLFHCGVFIKSSISPTGLFQFSKNHHLV